MNVVYSSSDAYCSCMCVSLVSLFENNSHIERLDVYVLSTDISNVNKANILAIAERYHRTIRIIDAKQDFIDSANQLNLSLLRGAYNTYSRLMLNSWFSNLDRVIVIDSDTLVVGDIGPMWEMPLDGALIAAVPEIGVYSKYSTIEDSALVDSLDVYYNMGVVVINLKEWRNKNIDTLLAGSLSIQKEPNLVADQSIINRYLHKSIVRMNLKYNFYSPIHGTNYRWIAKVFGKKKVFDRSEIMAAQREPSIIHFYGHSFERPWFKPSASKYKKKYLHYWRIAGLSTKSMEKWRKTPNKVLLVYDLICFVLLKMRLYNFCLWFRYSLGQRMKRKLGIRR